MFQEICPLEGQMKPSLFINGVTPGVTRVTVKNKDPSYTFTDFIKPSSKEYTCETLNSPLHVEPSFSVFSQVHTPTTVASHVPVQARGWCQAEEVY